MERALACTSACTHRGGVCHVRRGHTLARGVVHDVPPPTHLHVHTEQPQWGQPPAQANRHLLARRRHKADAAGLRKRMKEGGGRRDRSAATFGAASLQHGQAPCLTPAVASNHARDDPASNSRSVHPSCQAQNVTGTGYTLQYAPHPPDTAPSRREDHPAHTRTTPHTPRTRHCRYERTLPHAPSPPSLLEPLSTPAGRRT
eukprot:349677-Chlamydomonas_euryale.AAC.2